MSHRSNFCRSSSHHAPIRSCLSSLENSDVRPSHLHFPSLWPKTAMLRVRRSSYSLSHRGRSCASTPRSLVSVPGRRSMTSARSCNRPSRPRNAHSSQKRSYLRRRMSFATALWRMFLILRIFTSLANLLRSVRTMLREQHFPVLRS